VNFVADYTDIILSFSVLTGVVYLVLIGNKFFRYFEETKNLNRSITDREFYSNYSDERLRLERQIADLNIKLTQSVEKFQNINHLALSGQKKNDEFKPSIVDYESFFRSISLNVDNLKLDKNLIFVLTPFHPSERSTFSTIVEAFDSYGARIVRGDEQSVRGDILSHIIKLMLSSRLVIADVSSRNPNVMYELGIAHALGKDVVMISNTKDELPFDINSRRIIFYDEPSELVHKLRREIGRKIFYQELGN